MAGQPLKLVFSQAFSYNCWSAFLGDVDDRPLAASAFKAWLGSPERTKLEEKVESAYQRHVIKEKPHSRSKSESEGKRTKVRGSGYLFGQENLCIVFVVILRIKSPYFLVVMTKQ